MDPGTGTGLTVLGTAIGSKSLVERVLGPTADYLGEELRGWTEKRVQNVARIFEKADEKLGDEVEGEGAVPPRVMKDVIDEGSYFDNELGAEYFGGILAASRGRDENDDRGTTFTKLLTRLSTYQISTHYFLYTTMRRLYFPAEINVSDPGGRRKLETFTPLIPFEIQLGINNMVAQKGKSIVDHSLFGLNREGLLGDFEYGRKNDLNKAGEIDSSKAGIVYMPTAIGISLYLWAHGHSDETLNTFLSKDVVMKSNVDINLSKDSQTVALNRWDRDEGFDIEIGDL
jgi:hypothetical protein